MPPREMFAVCLVGCRFRGPSEEALRKRLEESKGAGEEKLGQNRAVTGLEHANRDAEVAEKMNIDHKRQNSDINASSPQSPKRTLTAAERRALEAEKRAAMRQQRMRELEEDAMKAQVVIAQVKAMSASSLETLAINSPDAERKASDNEFHDSSSGGLGRRSSGSSTKST